MDTLKKELEDQGHQVDILAHHPNMQTIYKYSFFRNEFGRTLLGDEIDKSSNNLANQFTIKDVLDHQLYQYYAKHLPHVDPEIRWRDIERYTFEVAAALLNLDGYDLIHTHDILSTRALWRVKPKHIPLVATMHGLLSAEYLNSGEITSKDSLRWRYAAAEEYYGHVSTDATIVSTQWQTNQLIAEYGVPGEKITVIPYAFDLVPFLEKLRFEPYPPLRADQRPSNKWVIACPARLVPEKDHQTLIAALHTVKQQRNDFVCWFIGDGKLRDELEIQANNLGVREHLVFFGDRWDIPALLRMSDMVVLPSIQDMHPYTLMEAQVAGKPCIGSDAGGIPEVVRDGETGLIFETGNSVQLAEKILQLLGDSRLRSRLATNAASWGKTRFSSRTMLQETMKVYQRVMAAKNSSTEYPITTTAPNLTGMYGLSKTRAGQDDHPENIFAFAVDPARYDAKNWSTILQNVPEDYSIPDTAFIKALTQR
jgi:glycosyltransferase involved in cell wall biosynthesis